MEKRKIIKIGLILALVGVLVAGSVGFYMFNVPHRDVQSQEVDFSLTTSEIVSEYLSDMDAANEKYLAADGDSKILAISGTISKISEDFSGQKVVLLKETADKAGVSTSFTEETNANASELKVGQKVTIKGVIRSGAAYDEDLEMYEHVILDKCDIVN